MLRELTEKVSLTGPDGRLNRDAIGWARRPLVDCAGLVRRPGRAWGRTKRWEYWLVVTPTHLLAQTVSSIDYAAVHEAWVLDRATGRHWGRSATVLPARDVVLPANLHGGPASGRARDLDVEVRPLVVGTRLSARIPDASWAVTVVRPADQDCLAVVVPWSDKRFQYTVKDVGLPASGTVTIEGREYDVPEGSWAVLDHGRGRWPYDVRWNWAAASGVSGGRRVGLQLGGGWTQGTGSTENGVFLDGRLHKIGDELAWSRDPADWLRPWRVSGGGLAATLVPFHDKQSRTNLGVVASRTDQCFGTWSGTFTTADGETVAFDGLVGFAEDVHNRW
jgi:hypothetical protein